MCISFMKVQFTKNIIPQKIDIRFLLPLFICEVRQPFFSIKFYTHKRNTISSEALLEMMGYFVLRYHPGSQSAAVNKSLLNLVFKFIELFQNILVMCKIVDILWLRKNRDSVYEKPTPLIELFLEYSSAVL